MKKVTVYSKDCACDSGHEYYGSGCRMICSCVKDVPIKELNDSYGLVWGKLFNDLSEKKQKEVRKKLKGKK